MLKKFDLLSLKIDLFSIVAVLINCAFINLYAYEYKIKEANIILNGSIIAYVLCMSSIACYYMRNFISPNGIAILWLVCLIYGLGFFPAYTVFITGGKKYLLLNLSSSLLLLAMMTDWLIFMIVSIIGLSSAFIIFFLTNVNQNINYLHPAKKTYFIYYIMSYTFIGLSLFMRKKEKSNETKMDFMKVFGSAIAHEVNAPLSSMRMMADALDTIINSMTVKKQEAQYLLTLDEIDYEMLTSVIQEGFKRSANDAIQIVEMLLAVIREKYTDQKAVANISSIVKEAISFASHLDLRANSIELKIENDFKISGNIKLLKHVIYNLIKNSFKHGGENVQILIEIKLHKIVVLDNGVGISKDKIDKIFNAFFTDGNGSGIGLAFAKFVLYDMNATISCKSEVGKFTRFEINFNTIENE